METPSSVTRVALNNSPTSKKNEETEMVFPRQRNAKCDRSVLIDITNDSPIVGLAMESLKTPSSLAKKKDRLKQTPGSGEALLRGQVKTLLQKVEEEAEISKLSFENLPFLQLEGFMDSPSGLLAPTPANTPHLLKLSCNETNEESKISQAVMTLDRSKEENLASQKISQTHHSSLSKESDYPEKSFDEDEDEVNGQEEEYEDNVKEGYNKEGLLDELCEEISKITVKDKNTHKISCKHTRFLYNSDDEIEGEKVVAVSPGIIRLKGIPTPEGKHMRFPEEEED